MQEKVKEIFATRTTCRLCGSRNIKKVLPLAPTALCDAYVSKERVSQKQDVYPLDLFLCYDCGYVHLPYVVDPEIIYRDYIYVTTSSMGLADHFKNYAASVLDKIRPAAGGLIVDIGSNDGTLLAFFKAKGMRVLGIEPAVKIAQNASLEGIETLPNFFNTDFASDCKKKYGPAKIITVNNLLANVDDLNDFANSIRNLLADDGVLVVESSYLGDMIKNMVFDFIYHEHLSYFSVKPLMKFFKRFKMDLIDVEKISTKGGSLRYYFQPQTGPRKASAAVTDIIREEEILKLDSPDTYRTFSNNINALKSGLRSVLTGLKAQGKSIAGYGASATSTTLIYHFGLADMMDYIVDDNQAKYNTFSPGYHIPVVPSEEIYIRKPDYIIMLAWRYAEPIMKKHQGYIKQGGHFIIPIPGVRVI